MYKGIISNITSIIISLLSLLWYKGIVPALLLTSHGAVQFASYEALKSLLEKNREHGQQQSPVASMIIGGLSKILASTITYPYQVIKSRIQQRDLLPSSSSLSSSSSLIINKNDEIIRYNGTIDCIIKTWKNEGIRGFFRGVIPNALKVAPSAALTFVVYEETLKFVKLPNN